MNFFKIIIAFFVIFLGINYSVYAENHDTSQNIVDKAKEINKKIKKQQTDKEANIKSEVGDEEPLPLNDPFAGDGSTGGKRTGLLLAGSEDEKDEMSLYNFKLAGLISGKDNSYISLVNTGGEVVTVTIGQYLGKIKLVDLRLNEAIFEKEDKSFIILDFNNVIRESDEY